eukprot:scaffold52686_cov28-Tisochrysis_lutea.AAC.3
MRVRRPRPVAAARGAAGSSKEGGGARGAGSGAGTPKVKEREMAEQRESVIRRGDSEKGRERVWVGKEWEG